MKKISKVEKDSNSLDKILFSRIKKINYSLSPKIYKINYIHTHRIIQINFSLILHFKYNSRNNFMRLILQQKRDLY